MCRSASILCCGKESLRIELRVRTICELVLNEAFYLQPSITSLFAAEATGKMPWLPHLLALKKLVQTRALT